MGENEVEFKWQEKLPYDKKRILISPQGKKWLIWNEDNHDCQPRGENEKLFAFVFALWL